jgi:hypothetical protein
LQDVEVPSDTLLHRHRGSHRIGGRTEGGHHPVAGRRYNPALLVGHHSIQCVLQAVEEGVSRLFAQPCPQRRGANDIGEDNGRRHRCHGRSLSCPTIVLAMPSMP